MMASRCLETEGSSSERRFYIQVWHSVFYMHRYKQSFRWTAYTHACKTLYTIHIYTSYNRLPEGELSGSKHVEDIIN